jgi:uncharacterized protein
MKISGHHVYPASPETVYSVFTDQAALLQATPGLEHLEATDPDHFKARLKVGLGGFALVYEGTLVITERQPGSGYRLQVDGVAANGSGHADVRFRFLPLEGMRTRAEYDAEIELSGEQPLLPSLARGLMEFFLHGMAEALAKRQRRQ